MLKRFCSLIALVASLSITALVQAKEVEVVRAEFSSSGGNGWAVNVTLQHEDTGWQHYADQWRIVDSKGWVLAKRVLHHPHVEEQPFTRGLSHVQIPEQMQTVFIEARDNVHGWSSQRLKVDMSKAVNGVIISAKP